MLSPNFELLTLEAMHNLNLLKDLYAHMKWADAQIWKSIEATPGALSDEEVRERLFHIHMTQCLFLKAWKEEEIVYEKSDAYPTVESIKQIMAGYYADLPVFVDSLTDSDLQRPMVMPWVRFFERTIGQPAIDTTLGETMYQIASHSVHHRAQVNLQLRAHGGEPPFIDYIVWLWLGRPGTE